MTCPVCRQSVDGMVCIFTHRDTAGNLCPASGAPIRITNHEGGIS